MLQTHSRSMLLYDYDEYLEKVDVDLLRLSSVRGYRLSKVSVYWGILKSMQRETLEDSLEVRKEDPSGASYGGDEGSLTKPFTLLKAIVIIFVWTKDVTPTKAIVKIDGVLICEDKVSSVDHA